MKIFITGAQGMLGHDIVRVLDGKHRLIAPTLEDLDIGNAAMTAEALSVHKPDIVINCAAYTDVDGCESHSDEAFAVNADGAKNLALACRHTGAKLIHISTDYVFDGTGRHAYGEDAATNPLSVYGRSKLAGELHIQDILKDYAIIRTEWLYGPRGRHFVGRILELARERDLLEVVDDQIGSPTSTADLAEAIAALLSVPACGIYHITNAGSCSWFAFARKILELSGSPCRVEPISSQRLARPAPRPAYSVLDCSKFIRETGHVLRPWDQALAAYLQEQPKQ